MASLSPRETLGHRGCGSRSWAYGCNDHLEEVALIDRALQSFQTKKLLKEDFSLLCRAAGIVPHPALLPPPGTSSDASNAVSSEDAPGNSKTDAALSLQSQLFDRASMYALRHVLPTSHHLESLRFNGCCLDVDGLGWLRQGLADTTVISLQIDWNPVELPLDKELARELNDAQSAQVDALELQRVEMQRQRRLRAYREVLAAKAGSFEDSLAAVVQGTFEEPSHRVTAEQEPLTSLRWCRAFAQCVGFSTEDASELFELLDDGSAYVSLSQLRHACCQEMLPPEESSDEALDPIASAFCVFMDATAVLELLSFRCCRLARLEGQAMAEALKENKHLRAVNLWGNHICDRAAASLGDSLEVNFTLQFLGLGRNLITHEGLRQLVKNLGATRLNEKSEYDALQKKIATQQKDRDKALKSAPPRPVDPKGRKRFIAEFHVDSVLEKVDASGAPYYLWYRNCSLQTLSLEHNPITDASVVAALQPFGAEGANLVLTGTPAAKHLGGPIVSASAAAVDANGDAKVIEQEGEAAGSGWKLVL